MRIVYAAVAGCLVLTTGACGTGGVTYAAVRTPDKTADAENTVDAGNGNAGNGERGNAGNTDAGIGESAAEAGRLRTALGRLDGLPEGFFSHARAPWRPPFRPRAHACRLLFDAAAGRPSREGLGGMTAVTYAGAHTGELAGIGLAVYDDGGAAAAHLAALRDALVRCVTADGGTPYDHLAASRTPLPGIGGPDAAARALTGRVGGYPYRMHVVVARSGHTVIAFVHAGLTPPDPARTAELARLLVREVGTLDA